jgi:hypothetical protein
VGRLQKCLACLGVVSGAGAVVHRQAPALHREMQLRNRGTGWIDIYYREGEGRFRFGRSVPGPGLGANKNGTGA